jgi:DNA-binding CsgD family transcriptional regulator
MASMTLGRALSGSGGGAFLADYGPAHRGVLLLDDDRRHLEASAEACEILDQPRRSLVGVRADDLALPRLRGRIDALWDQLLRDGSLAGHWEVLGDAGPVAIDFVAVANVVPSRHVSLVSGAVEAQPPAATLSPREQQILTLVACGLRGRDIAARLHLSPSTVESHMRRLMDRLGARSRAHAVALALEQGEIRTGTTGTPPDTDS